jgi:hypothetical protein
MVNDLDKERVGRFGEEVDADCERGCWVTTWGNRLLLYTRPPRPPVAVDLVLSKSITKFPLS